MKNNTEKIENFLRLVDKDFPVPLSCKQDLSQLARKLCEKGTLCAREENGEIVALVAGYTDNLENNKNMSEDLKSFTFVLIQASLFSNEGITKKQLGSDLNISESTVNKRLAKLREIGLLLEEKCKPAKYLIDLNKLS